MESDVFAERYIGKLLWGYPDLLKEFYEGVRPSLVKVRNKRYDEEDERECEEYMAMMSRADNDPHHSALEDENPDKNATASDSPHISPSHQVSLRNILGHLDSVEIQYDKRPQADDQLASNGETNSRSDVTGTLMDVNGGAHVDT